MTNSAGWYSPYSSCFIRPDGRVVEEVEQHKDGVIINTVDTSEEFYDPSGEFRTTAIDGKLDNAPDIDDERSRDVYTLYGVF